MEEIVKYMEETQNDQQGMLQQILLGIPFTHYLQEMITGGTYVDELTIRKT